MLDMNLQGSITLSRDDFGDKLWTEVGQAIRLLTHAGYQCIVRNDEPAFDIIVIEFTYDSRLEWGNYVVALNADQYDDLMYRLNNDSDSNENDIEND